MSEDRISISFDGPGLDKVINGLASFPFRDVFGLISDIQAQVKAHHDLKTAEAPKE